MNPDEKEKLADTIQHRTGVGPTPIVSGWQAFLTQMLSKMKPYLRPGALITFQTLTAHETSFFRRLQDAVPVGKSVVAFYLPPSVRHQMMGGDQDGFEEDRQVDSGVLIACRPDDHSTIVNTLFAHPAFTPAIDVYENGQLIAGYQYADINACMAELGAILDRHLTGPSVSSGSHQSPV